MSYNLIAEGRADYEALAALAAQFPALELFPVPADHDGDPDALGIAVPRARAAEAAFELPALIRVLWARQLRVHDLYAGAELTSPDDLAALVERLG